MGYYDWTLILLIPAILFTMYAQAKVNRNFKKYSRVRSQRNLTGVQAAQMMLRANGLNDVAIERVSGNLSDHYDPRKKVLRLSDTVYGVNSVAAISVACHEVGHAIQHAEHYAPLKIRNFIVPAVNFASNLSWPMVLIGIFLLAYGSYIGDLFFNLGIVLMLAVIFFHLITLPVEFNASHRALEQMEELSLIIDEEKRGAKKVLRAAAMTYIAALAVAVANLLRILALRGSRD